MFNDFFECRLGNVFVDVKVVRFVGVFLNVVVVGGFIGKGLIVDRVVEGIGVVFDKMLDDIRDGVEVVL